MKRINGSNRSGRFRPVVLGILAAVLLAAWPAVAAGAEYYRWFDDEGLLHISNIPPENAAKKSRELKTTRFQEPVPGEAIRPGLPAGQPAPGAAPVTAPAAVQAPAPGTAGSATPPAAAPVSPPRAVGPSGPSPGAGQPAATSPAEAGPGTPGGPFGNATQPDESTRGDGDTRGSTNPRLQ